MFAACLHGHAQTPPTVPLTDVRYGPYDNDVLDFHPTQTKEPAPVLINYHGGGWTGGDKKKLQSRAAAAPGLP